MAGMGNSFISIHGAHTSAVKRAGVFAVGVVAWAFAGLMGGCARQEAAKEPAPSLHKDVPPHGGTAVALGEDYHVEFVLDRAEGTLAAYVLDGEMEDFIRVAAPSFVVTAKVGAESRALNFAAVADAATGETVGSTSLFVARADWLRNTPGFDAVLVRLEIRGNVYEHVAFNFPRGNETH
jgi:hypothetical protein